MARILLVENDHDNIRLMTRLLEHNGHAIDVVENAQDAIDRAGATSPELILMDMEMPMAPGGMDDPFAGLHATREIKADAATAAIPIIALTAALMPQQRERIAEAGCDDFQEKPIRPFKALLEKLDKHLGAAS